MQEVIDRFKNHNSLKMNTSMNKIIIELSNLTKIMILIFNKMHIQEDLPRPLVNIIHRII